MRRAIAVAALVAVAGCGKAPPGGGPQATHIMLDAAAPAAGYAPPATVRPAPPHGAQIAYTYTLDFQLAGGAVTRVEQAHVALCDRLGSARCRIVAMNQDRGAGEEAEGSLELQVDAAIARAFGDSLVAVAAQAGGTAVDRGIEAEDLSRQIVDTQARIRAKRALADRLMDVLKTHKGSVAALVAAERALADVQEEIDAARSELADAQGRVAMSTFKIGYGASPHFESRARGPLASAWAQLGGVVGGSIGGLLLVVAAVLPWLLVIALSVSGARRFRRWQSTEADREAAPEAGPESGPA